MQISVRTFEGKTIDLDVQLTDTISNVKKQIQNKESIRTDLQRLVFANETLQNDRTLSSYSINKDAILYLVLKSGENSNIVAGGYGPGNNANQLCFPYGLFVDDNQRLIIADWGNHRIVQWKIDESQGQVIAGGNGQGNQLNQLNCPTDVLVDKQTNSLLICDRGNKRVIRWSCHDETIQGEILIEKIACWGIAQDDQGFVYVSDTDKHQVTRYQIGDKHGTVVAGGHGRGTNLNQLNEPTYIFVDQQKNIYVSDTKNYRVMKWNKDASQGTLVVKGCSRGLYVDESESIYIADYGNHRLLCWPKGAKEAIVISRGNDETKEINQVYYPWGLSPDRQGQLFVTDHFNHRIQRFSLQATV